MKVIGITGGVGAGKSTVLSLLKDIVRCEIIMADDVAKKLMNKDMPGYIAVLKEFGDVIIADDGEIDRNILASIIFSEPQKRELVNSIIHPLVKKDILNVINEHRKCMDADYIFVEAALFLNDNYDEFCDEVWYIYVPENIRRSRLKSDRGYSDDRITGIFESQLSDDEFRSRTDRTIDNQFSVEETYSQLVKILKM